MPLTGKTITQLPYVNYTALTDNDLLIVENFQVVTGITKSTTITDLKDYVFSGFSDVFVTGGTYSNGDVIFTNNTGGTFSVSGFYTGATDSYITGGTYSNGVTTLTDSTGGTITISGYYTGATDVFVTGGTYLNGDVTFTNNTGGTFNVSGFYTGATDVFVTGGTYSNGDVTFTNNTGGTFNVNGFYTGATDVFVTGGTYLDGTTTFTNNTGGTFNVTGYYTGATDVFVTGGTYSNGDITFTNNTGGTFNVNGLYTGATDVFVTGGTYSNGSATFTNNTGGTFNVDGFYTGATDVFVTGGTYSNGSAIFTNNTGGTFNVDGFYTGATDVFVTGGTFDKNTSTLTFTNNTGDTFNVTGLTDVYVSGMTFNTGNYNLTIDRNDGVSFTESLSILGSDLRVTGGTYDPITGNGTFTNNTGGTFVVTGFLVGYTDLYVSGGTYSNGTATFTNTSGGTFTVPGFYTGATDVFVTGGTYSNGDILFTNNTGGTFNVTGLYTGATDVFVTGGTYSNGDVTFTNNTGGTFNVSGFYTGATDVFVTGGTYSNGDITFTNNTGGTFDVTGITTGDEYLPLSGGTVTGNTIFTQGLTATTFSATTYQNYPTQDLSTTLGYGDSSGVYDISMGTGTSIVSDNVGSRIDMDFLGGPGNFRVTTDDGVGNESILELSPVGANIGTQTNTLSFSNSATIFNVDDIFNVNAKYLSTLVTDTILIQDNATSAITTSTGFKPGIIIGSELSTINSGIKNVVIAGGDNITATTNNTLYSDNFNIFSTPINNNSNTQILSRNASTGNIQYTSLSYITGLTSGDTFVTGGTYNNQTGNATFTNNTGGTFNVTGFFTGDSTQYLALSGGTVTGNTTFTQSLTGNTIFVSGETASRILSTDASKKITSLDTATYPSLTELSYVKGVTSSIQTQLNGFVPTTRLINTTLPLSGGGNLTIDRTLTIMDAQADGSTKGAAAFTVSDFNATSGIISIDYTNGQSSSSVNKGFLTSTDWNTFNNKVSTGRTINTTAPLLGGGNLSSDRTLSISDAVADGINKGAATFTPSDFNASSGVISIDYANAQAASSVNKGFLTSADWTTFNDKTKEIYNYNTTGQTIGALAAHIVGTKLPLTNVKEGTTVTWKISVTKTAAGNAAPIWSVKVGSAGNNTDTTFLTITSPPQTNTADTGYITIECIFRSGINTNSVLVSHLNLSHNSGTNGLANVFSWDGWAQSSSNPFINPNHFISLSVAPGILSSWTINQVSATMTNTQ